LREKTNVGNIYRGRSWRGRASEEKSGWEEERRKYFEKKGIGWGVLCM